MAKNIVIQTDGVAHTYTGVEKIQTQNPEEGGDGIFIPLDEVQTGIKYIVKNGTYDAEDDNVFGYSQVMVDSKGTTTGFSRDGRIYSVHVDDDGYIVETVMADAIKIITPPTKTAYADGETLNLAGLVVQAFSQDEYWAQLVDPNIRAKYENSIIPIAELTVEPAVAKIERGRNQTCIVTWERYDDFEPLTAELYITVAE